MSRSVTLQVLRVPALLALLGLLGPALRIFQPSFMRAEMPRAGWAWGIVATVILVFVAVALLGRETEHVRAILIVEAAIAGLIGLIPPTMWFLWFGVSGPPMLFGIAAGSTVVPVLALTWLVIVAATGVRQYRVAVEMDALDRDGDRIRS